MRRSVQPTLAPGKNGQSVTARCNTEGMLQTEIKGLITLMPTYARSVRQVGVWISRKLFRVGMPEPLAMKGLKASWSYDYV